MAASTQRRFLLTAALIASVVAVVAVNTSSAAEAPVGLGTASSFAILAGTGVTNTGASTVNGDLGTCPTPAITGFPPGIVTGTQHPNDAVACQAKSDLLIAFNDAASRATTVTLANPDLAGMTLAPGVYDSPTLANSGTVTLDGLGDPNSVFILRAASTLITAPNSVVALTRNAQACNVFWLVGSSATLGVGSTFVGTVMALTSVTANTGALITGRLLARNGAVTLDTNTINVPTCATAPTSTSISTSTTTAGPTTSTTSGPTTSTTAAPTTTTTTTIPPITFPPITFPPFLGIPPIILPPITFPQILLPLFGFPPITVPPITLPTTTTTAVGATTTTVVGATTTTTTAGATTTTTSTAVPGGGTTGTTSAPATTTTTPASGTTTTVGLGSTTTTDQASAGVSTTVGPGANTTSSAPLLSPAVPALRVQDLPRTGQGTSGPLSLAVVSILLGAMLLLTPRRGAVPLPSGAGYAPGGLDHRQPRSSAGITVQPAAIAQVATPVPETFDLLEDLERQLQAADARMAARRAMHRPD